MIFLSICLFYCSNCLHFVCIIASLISLISPFSASGFKTVFWLTFCIYDLGFLHPGKIDVDSPLSLMPLQNLKLERLNLEHTQVRDEALYPLSSFLELRYLSLKSASLADVSLYYLSSIPKLTNLSVCDAVLTNYGIDIFKAPETLKLLDLRGCWLLTEDTILSFCRRHPQVEVIHELGTVYPFNKNGPHHSSPSRSTSRTVQMAKKKDQAPVLPYLAGNCYLPSNL